MARRLYYQDSYGLLTRGSPGTFPARISAGQDRGPAGLAPAWLTGASCLGALVLNSGSPDVCVSASLVFLLGTY
jgi:hypothetical protein